MNGESLFVCVLCVHKCLFVIRTVHCGVQFNDFVLCASCVVCVCDCVFVCIIFRCSLCFPLFSSPLSRNRMELYPNRIEKNGSDQNMIRQQSVADA